MPAIGGATGTKITGVADVPGLVAALAAKIEQAQLAAALAGITITQDVINNIVSDTFVTQVAGDTTFVTQLIENNEYVTQLTTLLTQLTAITQNNTYITNLITQINATVNGKKGIANELATLDSGGHLTFGQVPPSLLKAGFSFVIEGGAAVIETGFKGFIECPYAGVITACKLLADIAGSIVVDIWKDTYANYPPVVGDSICASAKPTLSGAIKSNGALTGWTTAVAAGDIFGFNVDSAATLHRVTVGLAITRS